MFFTDICECVKGNQDSFAVLSEYELSKLNSDNPSFEIGVTGEYQDERIIINDNMYVWMGFTRP